MYASSVIHDYTQLFSTNNTVQPDVSLLSPVNQTTTLIQGMHAMASESTFGSVPLSKVNEQGSVRAERAHNGISYASF